MRVFYHKQFPLGVLDDGNILRKDIKYKHIYHKTNSIGLDAKMYDQLPETTEIRIRVDGGTNDEKIYSIKKKVADECFVVHEWGDFGKQYMVPIVKFTQL